MMRIIKRIYQVIAMVNMCVVSEMHDVTVIREYALVLDCNIQISWVKGCEVGREGCLSLTKHA